MLVVTLLPCSNILEQQSCIRQIQEILKVCVQQYEDF